MAQPKISVFLDEETHASAKKAAIDAKLSLARWVEKLVLAALKRRKAALKRRKAA